VQSRLHDSWQQRWLAAEMRYRMESATPAEQQIPSPASAAGPALGTSQVVVPMPASRPPAPAAAEGAEFAPPANSGLHVAIISDGNGRWATSRGLPRSAGHRAGAETARRIIEAAPRLGIDRQPLVWGG